MQNQSLVIIGGGGCGISVLAQFIDGLSNKELNGLSITIINREKRFGPGLPYSTDSDSNILNMKAHAMGIFAEQPLHFVEWVNRRKSDLGKRYETVDLQNDPFPPRSLYGLYLEDVLSATIERAKGAGISVNLMQGSVVDARESADGVQVELENGTKISADYAVLALGNFASVHYQDLKRTLGYFHSPWPENEFLKAIEKNADVCILGSRLTAVDTALMLATHGHKGKMTMVSRNGLLPKVQGMRINPAYETLLVERVQQVRQKDGTLRFKDFVRVLQEEIERVCGRTINWPEVLHPAGSGRDIFFKDVAASENNEVAWQDILASTSNVIENFWHWMPLSDREEFMGTFFSLWFVYRHAMPMKNARKIASLFQNGQLDVRSNPVVTHNAQTGLFEIVCSNEQRTGTETIAMPYVINATGEGLDVRKIQSPLLQNLLQHGDAVPNTCGGVEVDFETCALAGRQGFSQRMYTLGSLTRGTHFYTNDIHRNAVHAKRIADALSAKLLNQSHATV